MSFRSGFAGIAKRVAVSLLAVSAFSASSANAAVLNLITDGSFDYTAEDEMFGTYFANWNGYGATVDNANVHSASNSALFYNSGYLDGISQRITTTPGVTYELSYYLMNNGSTTNNKFQVNVNNLEPFEVMGPGALLSTPNTNDTRTDLPAFAWTPFQLQFTAANSFTEIGFRGMQYQDSTGYFRLDDVSVTAVPEPTCLALIGVTAGLLMSPPPRCVISIWANQSDRPNPPVPATGGWVHPVMGGKLRIEVCGRPRPLLRHKPRYAVCHLSLSCTPGGSLHAPIYGLLRSRPLNSTDHGPDEASL